MKYLIDIPDNWKELNDEEFIKSVATSLRNGEFIPDKIAKIMLKEKEQFIYSLSDIAELPGKRIDKSSLNNLSGTQTVAFQLGVISTTLLDISRSLAILADKAESEVKYTSLREATKEERDEIEQQLTSSKYGIAYAEQEAVSEDCIRCSDIGLTDFDMP